MKAFISLCGVSFAALTAIAQPAMAQTAPGAEAASGVSTGDIIVNAQRKSENLQDVPASILAISGEQLVNLNIRNLETLQLATPGFVADAGYSYAQTTIRGVGTDLPNVGLEPAVGVYVDGSYLARAVGGVFDLVDTSSVQVLKGPQGTLWGRNATGGAVLINTADPTNEFSGSLTGEYGRFDHMLTEGVVNLPVTDTLAVRVAGRFSKEDGYVKNLADGKNVGDRDVYDVRAKALWTPTDAFSALLTLEHSYQEDQTGGLFRQIASFPLCAFCATPGVTPTAGFYNVNLNQPNSQDNRTSLGNLKLHYDAGSISFDTTTIYRRDTVSNNDGFDQDYTPLNIFNYLIRVKSEVFQQDAQATSNFDGPLNFLVGASYYEENALQRTVLDGDAFAPLIGFFGDVPRTDNTVGTKSYSVFGDVYFTPVDRVKITLGGRYTRDERDLLIVNNESSSVGVAALPPGSPLRYNQDASFNSFTPRAVIAYDLDTLNLYASYNKGFKAGGFATTAFAPTNIVEPEKIKSYEIGAKFVSPDRRFRLNTAAFFYDYTNLQRSIVGPSGTFFFQNAAKAEGKGFDVDGTAALTNWLDVSAGVSYLHTRYTSFRGASVSIPAPGAGLVASFADLTGEPLSRAPKWTVFVAPTAHFDLAGGWSARVSAVGRYTSEYDFAPGRGGPLRLHYQEDLFLLNGSAAIRSPGEKYEIGVYANNITDKKYLVQRTDAQGAFGIIETPAKPMTYGVRLTARF